MLHFLKKLSLCLGLLLAPKAAAMNHDDLTRAWRQGDYAVATYDSLKCAICRQRGVPGIATVGCHRHFPEENKGTCFGCLADEGYFAEFMMQGAKHSHRLGDHTSHQCLITPASLLALFKERGLLAQADDLALARSLDEPGYLALTREKGARERLKQERKDLERTLTHRHSRTEARHLQRRLYGVKGQLHLLNLHRDVGTLQAFLPRLRTAVDRFAEQSEAYDRAEGLCHVCGCYPEAKRHVAESLAAMAAQGKLWPQCCPACKGALAMVHVDNCSIIACDRCMATSGEPTRFCVVCRRTTRAGEVLYPGKPGLDHDQCPDLMRAHAADPSRVGSFDVCACGP